MPIRSEPGLRGEWAARTDTPKRSVFGNYRAQDPHDGGREEAQPPSGHSENPSLGPQRAIDLAVARAFIFRFLAKAYEDPTPESWGWLGDAAAQQGLHAACDVAAVDAPPAAAFATGAFESFCSAYVAAFGHAARGLCPLNEIEYGDIKADPLFQPHRLADLAAFYRAFGLQVAEDAGERHDHICFQLEFMCVLAAKEAYALQHLLGPESLAQCRDAQKKFLREHLGRWSPAFSRRLESDTADPALGALARFTRCVIESDCARFGVAPGGEDLLLRPVDEDAESLCASCGISKLPPGAMEST